MPLDLAASYDALPYVGKPQPPTHPDNLATVAWLYGLPLLPVARGRVLELGCADGGNLVPMAATLPESQFVGVDLSPRQIADAKTLAEHLDLKNIQLSACSITDVDESFGLFDFILCHGVYSWVPPEIQDRILDVCKQRLAPHGIAYISYNTYPGWYLRAAARDLMVFHTRRFDQPDEKVLQARTILTFLVDKMARPDSTYHRVLKEEVELLAEQRDSYVYHEHLDTSNSAVYFHEFAGRAAAKGLQFLAEAAYHSNPGEYSDELRTTLAALAPDRVQLEQYLDFATNRTFRRTLLCHAGLPVSPTPSSERLMHCGLTALARPTTEAPNIASTDVVEFRTDEGFSASTNIPFIKAALLALYEAWPRCVPFDELWTDIRARLPEPPGEAAHPALAQALLQCWLASLVEIHVTQAPLCLTIGDRPTTFLVARLQAKAGVPRVCSLRHRTVVLDDVDRRLVQLMDGTRTVAELRRELGEPADFEERLRDLARNSLVSG